MTEHQRDHAYFMSEAIAEAHKAFDKNEVPIGAVVVCDNKIIARAHNLKEESGQACDHAEILALKEACSNLNNWRLTNCTLYTTLEPCVMCAAALWQYRIGQVVFGATDPKGGGIVSLYQIGEDKRLNHRFSHEKGILEGKCSDLLKSFFKKKR
jgi:tRNA(adenine34) deaminase